MKKERISTENVASSPLLKDADYYFSEQIQEEAYLFTFEDKEYITQAAEPLPYLFFILEGKAKIYLTHENGKQTLLQFLKETDFIGELTLVQAEDTTKDVIAMGQTKCLGIPISILENVPQSDAYLFKKIAQYIGKKLLLRMEHFSINQSFELKYRLALIILETEINGCYKEKNAEIADYLGVSYRHYLYVLKQFQEQQLITKVKHGYFVNKEAITNLLAEMKN